MHHHQLIGIANVIHLTTRDLRELKARLRQILDYDTTLTDRDIAVLLSSLRNIGAAFALRHVAVGTRL